MPAIDALQDLHTDLIRKATNGSVFIGPSTVDPVDENDLFDSVTGDLKAGGLPTGMSDLGLTTDAGAAFARAVTTSDVTSWQSKTPSRSDVTADTTTLQVAAQETKLVTVGLYLGVDTAAVNAGSNGVVRIDMPETDPGLYYRTLSIAADETPQGEIVICRFLPRSKVTNWDNQAYAKGDDPILWSVTLTGYKDDVLGTPQSWLFGGAGFLARLSAMGFEQSATHVPVITGASRTALGTAGGGPMVEISGSGFLTTVPTTGVKFAATNSPGWTVVDDETIVAQVPAHAAGSGPIVVTNATGASTTGPTVTYS